MLLEASARKYNPYTGLAVKGVITVGLLALLFTKTDLREVNLIISGLGRPELAIAVLLTVGAVILSAYKWSLLLAARGWTLSLFTLTRLYFVGLFMNNFLPSSIGGDVMRIYQVGKKINNLEEAAASVILERILATIGLVVPAVIALLPNYRFAAKFSLPVVIVSLVLCTALGYVLVKPSLFLPLQKISWQWWQKLLNKVSAVAGIIRSFSSQPLLILKVTAYSILFQLLVVLINFCLVKAMGIEQINLWHCTLLVPIISAISMIPVSLNGLGIREAAYVLLFSPLGLSTSQAVTLSMLFFLVVTLISLLGGVFLLTETEGEELVVVKQ